MKTGFISEEYLYSRRVGGVWCANKERGLEHVPLHSPPPTCCNPLQDLNWLARRLGGPGRSEVSVDRKGEMRGTGRLHSEYLGEGGREQLL